ncbi:MAG: amino acid permease [Candidatus Jidaibacter sp.]|jgi:APA family basic amino acid/polyamine antiporter|nr:amino acid permease [Candidatus Jidaibacter sp.]
MSIKKYFRCRSVEGLIEEAQKSKDLSRSLSAFQLVMLGIGAIIGAGIFVFTGSAAGQHAGPAITLSFMLAGLACACVALCYAELASMIPVSGSSYTYAYSSLGELPAWIIACMIMLTYCLGAASVASGWSGYAQSFLADYNIFFPVILSDSFGTVVQLDDGTTVTTLFDLPALMIVALVTFVVFKGSETSAWVNTIIVFIKMFVLFAFIVLGATKIDPANWHPFIPKNTGVFGEFGWSGVISGASVIFLAYTGFDAVATAAQETKNPKRDLPIGIIGSLLVCIFVYVLVSAVLTGIVPYKELNVAEPMAIALNKMNMPWFSVVIKIGAIAGLTTVVLVLIYGAVRILYAVTHDGLLPKFLSKTHKKTHTPHILTFLVGLLVATLGSVLSVDKLVKLANFGALVTFSIVCIGTIYLRYKKPNIKREFRCPLVPFIPLAGTALLISILSSLPKEIFLYAGIWTGFMLLVYFLYGSKHSHLLHPRKHN